MGICSSRVVPEPQNVTNDCDRSEIYFVHSTIPVTSTEIHTDPTKYIGTLTTPTGSEHITYTFPIIYTGTVTCMGSEDISHTFPVIYTKTPICTTPICTTPMILTPTNTLVSAV